MMCLYRPSRGDQLIEAPGGRRTGRGGGRIQVKEGPVILSTTLLGLWDYITIS